ncbi:hypothetical protein F5Y17DRAFT_80494 [Xylariaceae sp. FL0594]|nr:hypothetical protein F5Y17DRAFT_80494 [Xylariaceae sp. FL0594]
MPSLQSVLATASLLLAVRAQEQYSIDPTTVPLATRSNWCVQEQSSCPLICNQISSGGYETNDCDPITLTYGCVCSNGISPNLSEYSLTVPFYVCQEWGNQCVAACGGNNACASDCRENHPCGARNPTRVNTTTTSSIATPTSSGPAATTSAGQLYGGLDDGDNSDGGSKPKPHNAAASLSQYGGVVGTIALAALVGLGSIML